ncbi:MAG TPA: MFS transporter [Steroidobacter sp.]|nr:MFS transporter [Steroidobacter sp.]
MNSGNIGWGAAPVVLAGLSIALGSWRYAAASAALLALLALGLIWVNRDALDDRAQARAAGRESGATQAAAGPEHPLAFLRLPSVWLCFLFFFFSTCALSAIQSFASPALQQMYGLPLSVTAFVVTGYMLFGAVGMVLGGFLAARAARLELIIGVCLMAAAALLALAATGVLPGMLAAFVAAAAGFGAGFAGPSRDMLIRRAAPPGAIGRVYGTVYSGLDLGFALAAPIFGAVLDHGSPAGVFYGAALMLCVGVASAALVGASVSRSARAVAPA